MTPISTAALDAVHRLLPGRRCRRHHPALQEVRRDVRPNARHSRTPRLCNWKTSCAKTAIRPAFRRSSRTWTATSLWKAKRRQAQSCHNGQVSRRRARQHGRRAPVAEYAAHRSTSLPMPDDTVLFARAKNDDAGTVADNAEPISDSAIDAVIGHVPAGFAARRGAASRHLESAAASSRRILERACFLRTDVYDVAGSIVCPSKWKRRLPTDCAATPSPWSAAYSSFPSTAPATAHSTPCSPQAPRRPSAAARRRPPGCPVRPAVEQ
jgi:hypothetical protein